jgi:probable phosphoglycerate mutase
MQPLYLVRHGESEWNAQGLIQGQTPHPALTPAGREQVRAAAGRIRADLGTGQQVALITTSDLVRARQTAAILAAQLGGTLRSDPRLREQHLGSWQGLTKQQAGASELGTAHGFSGGESPQDVRARMMAVIDGVDRSVITILVSHGRAIRQAVGHATGVTVTDAPGIPVRNGAVARWCDGRIDWLV